MDDKVFTVYVFCLMQLFAENNALSLRKKFKLFSHTPIAANNSPDAIIAEPAITGEKQRQPSAGAEGMLWTINK